MFHCNILQCMIRKAYRMYEIFFPQSMNPIFLWIRVSTPRNPHWKKWRADAPHNSQDFITCHHPSSVETCYFFWPSSYINRRSFSIPRNSWLSRFFLDLGGAENRCEILGRRMSGSSVGWFSDILDIFFWSFSENIYKNHGKPWEKQWKKQWKQPWKTMGTTMVNKPSQPIH